MKRRILTVILLLGAALPLLYSAGSVCLSVRHNRSLQARFTRAEQAYPYQEAVEKGELDLNAVSAYFRFALAPIKYHIQNEIRTPSAISYYADMEDDAPVFTIEKGEIVSSREQGGLAAGQALCDRRQGDAGCAAVREAG